jgi:hypothetical protein
MNTLTVAISNTCGVVDEMRKKIFLSADGDVYNKKFPRLSLLTSHPG